MCKCNFFCYFSKKYLLRFLLPNRYYTAHKMLPALIKWRLPIIPSRLQPSTFSVKSLNFRVRYGYGCFPLAIAATFLNNHNSSTSVFDQVFDILVQLGSKYYYSYTYCLSTLWSSRCLT